VDAKDSKLKRFGRWWVRQRVPVAQIAIRRPGYEAAALTIFAFLFIGLSICTGLLIRRWPAPALGAASFTQDLWYIFLFKLFGLLAVPLLMWRAWGYRARNLLLDWRPTAQRVTWVVVAFLLGFSVNLGHLEQIGAAWVKFSAGELAIRLTLALLLPLVCAGLPEEIVYRGMLQTRLEAVCGRAVAILVTALLFMAWHIPTRFLLAHGVEGEAGNFFSVLVGTGAPVFVAGMIFGLIWDRHRRILPLIAAHWGVDVLPTVSSMLGVDF
jgi:membrane protease YdiL (CAAX protease family)